MYRINDLIVYGKTGVCKIIDIKVPKDISFEQDQLYYVLQPLYQDYLIYAPVNTMAFMRPIISAAEAERLIDMIPTIQAEAYYNDRIQALSQHYAAILEAYNCKDLIELTMSIYAKERIIKQQKRKLGQIDQKFMKKAEELLFGEIAAALDMPIDEVQDYISFKVKVGHKEQRQQW